jgi:adenosine deaminase
MVVLRLRVGHRECRLEDRARAGAVVLDARALGDAVEVGTGHDDVLVVRALEFGDDVDRRPRLVTRPGTSVQPVPVDLLAAPKVLLHDHMDGGLRPSTLLELAEAEGRTLPASDAASLADWFVSSATAGTLERYLETFEHTVAALQTQHALERVAAEAVTDLAADGVVYAEIRYAPELCTAGGLPVEAVVEAVQAGFDRGVHEARAAGHEIGVGHLLCGMRQGTRTLEAARLAVSYRDRGVVGFDIAGPEAGFPPGRHAEAFALLHRELVPVTVHAGEAAGIDSIAGALDVGALRLGHGVRVVEDVRNAHEPVDSAVPPELGRVARWVRDRRVALECSPTSNVHTGASPSMADHQITDLRRLGFAVTVNTDNRLVSGTTMTREMQRLRDEAHWADTDLRAATITAAESAFLPWPARAALVERVRHGWDELIGADPA